MHDEGIGAEPAPHGPGSALLAPFAGLRPKGLAGVNQRGEEWPINGPGPMATMNKYLARNNKSLERIKATKKQDRQ